jgi:hypothetical protein
MRYGNKEKEGHWPPIFGGLNIPIILPEIRIKGAGIKLNISRINQ